MLVTIEGKKGEERLVVSSRQVAEDFEKRHTHVLDSIKELCSAENSAQSFFFETSYKDASGKSNKEYLMNKGGGFFFCFVGNGLYRRQGVEMEIEIHQCF